MRLQYFVPGMFLLLMLAATDARESVWYSGPRQLVDDEFFGMHVHRAAAGTAWPPISFAAWRLWDTHVTWAQLEPERNQWDFALLDRYVQLASEHHVEILLTLGLTPAWASARPAEASAYADGNAAEPRQFGDWEEYVRTVATRYKGTIHDYEIWNEPNAKATFTGSVTEIVNLSKVAYPALKSVDPSITVVSPSATTEKGIRWLDQFLQQGGCQYVDVIGYHFYVTPKPPEAMVPLIHRVQATLRRRNCNKPIWNTESGWTKPKHFSSGEEAAGYMMRTYILNWLAGVQRCYWYAWDNYNWSTLDLTSPADGRVTPAGDAYDLVQRWLVGATMQDCRRTRSGLWVCELERGTSRQHLVWSESGEQNLTVPARWAVVSVSNWQGRTVPLTSPLTIGEAPSLLSDQ